MWQSGKRFYHEIDGVCFQVKCSKAILNCLLQREEFKKDVRVMIGYVEVNLLYDRLKLRDYFKTNGVKQRLDEKETILGSILAISQALSTISVDLSPVEELTYTALVEKPSAYICWMQNGWIALRKIKEDWFLLDPGASAPERISGSYLDLIIGQLIAEKELIFKVSGGEFSSVYQRVNGSALRTYPLLPSAAYPIINPPDSKYIYLKQGTCSENSSVPTTSAPNRSDGPDSIPQNRNYSRSAASRALNNPETKVQRQNSTKPRDPSPHTVRVNELKHFTSELMRLRIARPIRKGSRGEENISLNTSSRGQIERLDCSSYEIPIEVESEEWQQPRSRQSRRRNDINHRSGNRSHSIGQARSDRQRLTPFECEWPELEQPKPQRTRRTRSRSEARNKQKNNFWALKDEPNSSTSVVDKGSTSKVTSTGKETSTVKESDKHSSCCICMDAQPEIAFIPCGHMCMCASCSQSFRTNESRCPICRKLIVSSLKVFTS